MFWSGPKRCPAPANFDINVELHFEYIFSAANLKAEIYGLPQVRDKIALIEMVQLVEVRFLFSIYYQLDQYTHYKVIFIGTSI